MKSISMTVKVKAIDTDYTVTGAAANAVYGQLLGHKTLEWSDSEHDYIVPFHAVIMAEITRSSSTVEAPTDANCTEE